MKTIFAVTHINQLPQLLGKNIVFLVGSGYEFQKAEYGEIVNVADWLGDQEGILRAACQLTEKILAGEPEIDGVRQLSVFSEVVANTLERIYTVQRFHDALVARGYERVVFAGSSWWPTYLQQYVEVAHSRLQVGGAQTQSSYRWSALLERFLRNKFSFKMLLEIGRRLVRKLDPYHWRDVFFCKQPNAIKKHQLWFYSTAFNFTKVGLEYESDFPAAFHYLIENKQTGGLPLRMAARHFEYLYAFMQKSFIPAKKDVAFAREVIQRHISRSELTSTEGILCQLFSQSAWLQEFWQQYLPQGLLFSRLFFTWLERTEPRAIIVGNPVFEGYLLQLARQKKIPTILLQHGVVAKYDRYLEHPIDCFIVKGLFFYHRLSSEAMQQAIIYNPVQIENLPHTSVQNNRDQVLFLTAPIDFCAFHVGFDTEGTLRAILQATIAQQLKLTIRVHPLERVETYKKLVNKILAGQTLAPGTIQYSQGTPITELLCKTIVVVMFDSTVFLECIRYNVPMIGFAWYYSLFKEGLVAEKILNLAYSLGDIEALIIQAKAGKLQGFANSIEYFMVSTPQAQFLEQLYMRLEKNIAH